MTWPAVAALDKSTPIVIPIAAVEQHGHHMPVATDAILLSEVVRRAELALGDAALFAPLQWLGNSHHHTDFPGTVSASPRLYLDLLTDLADNFLQHGFTRLFFLNGHGGNIIPGKQVVFELRQKHRSRTDLLLLFASYWDFAKPQLQPPDFAQHSFVQHEMGHACEWETSMMLRIFPNLVGEYQTLPVVPFDYGFEPAYRGWTTKDRSKIGHIGSPHLATPEKGEFLFATFASAIVSYVPTLKSWNGGTWA